MGLTEKLVAKHLLESNETQKGKKDNQRKGQDKQRKNYRENI